LQNLNIFVLLNEQNDKLPVFRLPLKTDTREQLENYFSEGIFSLLDTSLKRERFTGNYQPENGDLNYIKDFEIPEEIIETIKNPGSISDLIPEEKTIEQIRGLFFEFATEDNSLIVFQNITRSNFITSESIVSLFYKDNNFEQVLGPGINISKNIDIVFKDNFLYFWDYWTARQILDLSEYYRAATDRDLEEFIDKPAISIQNRQQFMEISDTWIRQKVALLLDSYVVNELCPTLIAEKAQDYNLNIEVINKDNQYKIVLSEDRQKLKEILKFLDEDYFIGPLTERQYLSSAKEKVVWDNK